MRRDEHVPERRLRAGHALPFLRAGRGLRGRRRWTSGCEASGRRGLPTLPPKLETRPTPSTAHSTTRAHGPWSVVSSQAKHSTAPPSTVDTCISAPSGLNTLRYEQPLRRSPRARRGPPSTSRTSRLPPGASGGATFDGRYVYYVPEETVVVRYDLSLPFGSDSSWTTFETTLVDANAKTFRGATFDGRYILFVPGAGASQVLRYDMTAPFGGATSWSTFDTTVTKCANAKGFAWSRLRRSLRVPRP